MMDYLKWRGDLSLTVAPFNEVDALILSMCSFIHYDGIVPSPDAEKDVLFFDAIHNFLLMPDDLRSLGLIVPSEIEKLADVASVCPRFAGTRLSSYVNKVIDEDELQFSALTYHLPDGSLFVAFRGTDDSLAGWKEDLNLAFMDTIPGEGEARHYLDGVASRYEGDIRVGGHSKGGHHAIYAAVHAARKTQKRIVAVYSNDGPGFRLETLTSRRYAAMQDKLVTFLPQSSVVGVVLEHDKNYRYIRSTGDGAMQHDPFSWEVSVDRFVYLHDATPYSKRVGGGIRAWLSATTTEERHRFIETFYKMISVSGARTLKELRKEGIRAFARATKQFVTMDAQERREFRRLFHLLVGQMNYRPKKKKAKKPQISAPIEEKKAPLPEVTKVK